METQLRYFVVFVEVQEKRYNHMTSVINLVTIILLLIIFFSECKMYLLNRFSLSLLGLLLLSAGIVSASFSDTRCKCDCAASKDHNITRPFIRIKVISSDLCKCEKMFEVRSVAPPDTSKDATSELLQKDTQVDYCNNNCNCKYETRNTFTIKFIVTFIVLVLSALCIYMVYLVFLDPYVTDKMQKLRNYPVGTFDNTSHSVGVSSSSTSVPGVATRHRNPSYLERVTDVQKRWKDKVEEQREAVYDKHAVLS